MTSRSKETTIKKITFSQSDGPRLAKLTKDVQKLHKKVTTFTLECWPSLNTFSVGLVNSTAKLQLQLREIEGETHRLYAEIIHYLGETEYDCRMPNASSTQKSKGLMTLLRAVKILNTLYKAQFPVAATKS